MLLLMLLLLMLLMLMLMLLLLLLLNVSGNLSVYVRYCNKRRRSEMTNEEIEVAAKRADVYLARFGWDYFYAPILTF